MRINLLPIYFIFIASIVSTEYCINPKQNNPCNPITNHDCCQGQNEIAQCVLDDDDDDTYHWDISKCDNDCETLPSGDGVCKVSDD